MVERSDESDSQISGGYIPGMPGDAAFVLAGGAASAIPVLVAAPHAGRLYPPSLMQDFRHRAADALRLEDRHIDAVAQGVAQATGAGLLVARAPRAMIDLNRAPEDIDWDMVERAARPIGGTPLPSRRARSGLGLFPRRLPGLGELWRRRLDAGDVSARLGGIHEPYHLALEAQLMRLRERWGAALLVDLHSMPPLPVRPGQAAAQIVVGDRFGSSCHGSIVATAFAHFAQCGREAAHNRPYAGGYVLDRHGDPRKGIHVIQIEIDRSRYLDEKLVEPGEGMASMIADINALVSKLAPVVAELGQDAGGWSLAAE